jgi:preprotein translocase subunit SecD
MPVRSEAARRPILALSPHEQDWKTTDLTCSGEEWEACLVAARADVVDARAVQGHPMSKGWSVGVQLSPEGSDALASATRAALGSQLATVVDGLVVSGPTVHAPVTVGSVVVGGGLDESAAKRIAASLEPNG